MTMILALISSQYPPPWLHTLYIGAITQSKRRAADWDSIVARLRSNSEFNFDEVAERYLYSDGIRATPKDIWTRIDGANGLWAMYTNAGVLMQLADYAAEHGQDVPEELIEELRSDALQIRIAVIMALVKYGFSRSGVAASVNAHRAATAYSAHAGAHHHPLPGAFGPLLPTLP